VKLVLDGSKVIVISRWQTEYLKLRKSPGSDTKLHYLIEDLTIASASSLRLLCGARASKLARTNGLPLLADAVSIGPECTMCLPCELT
jgi:hypothetical protein